MRYPIAVVSADWHVEFNAYVKIRDMTRDSHFSLEQIVDLCVDRELPLIGAGDLFDKNSPDSASVQFVVNQMDRLKPFGSCWYVQGQHEMVRSHPWMGLSPRAKHIHKSLVELHDVRFYGLDYQRPDNLGPELKAIPATADVLVCHQVWIDLMGRQIGGEGEFSQIPHVAAVITGDFHKHLAMEAVGASSQRMLVFSPGSICLQSIKEDPSKFVFILYDDLSYESVKLKTRPVRKLSALSPEGFEEVLRILPESLEPGVGLPDYISKPIVEIRYAHDIPDVHMRVHKIAKDRAHLFLTTIAKKEEDVVIQSGEHSETVARGLLGNLDKFCPVGTPINTLSDRLLRSDDPAELDKIEKEYIGEETVCT